MSVPYSSKIFGLIPWYSFLIVTGAAIAIWLAVREERRTDLKKDTVIDFALWVLPAGIIGARLYYVVFSWDQFKDDLLSVFRIWEGGIAIYGAVIAGLLTALIFSRKRKVSFLTLCDMIAPGLILAQAIGRWGNYFNQECYGLAVNNPSLQFFPFAVQISNGAGREWHMATFFYESVWNLAVFVFLLIARRKWFHYRGDVISFYAFCYACGRLKFPFKNFFFALILVQMMVPGQIFIIPQYLIVSRLHMMNTQFALLLPGAVTAFGTYLCKQGYQSLPMSLEEAAELDGCNIGQRFLFIMLPLTRSSLVSLGIFTALFAYKDLMWPMIVCPKTQCTTLTAALSRLQGQFTSNYPQLMAGAVMAVVPMLVLYLIFQKQFVEGIATSGGKL